MLWSTEEEEITSAWTMWKGSWKRWHLCSALKEGKERSLRRNGGEHQRLGKQRETKGYHLTMSFFVLILSVFDRIISKQLKQRRWFQIGNQRIIFFQWLKESFFSTLFKAQNSSVLARLLVWVKDVKSPCEEPERQYALSLGFHCLLAPYAEADRATSCCCLPAFRTSSSSSSSSYF